MSNKYVDYYQSANFRDNSGAIAHHRTKISEGGSPNGMTKDPNYTPVGDVAQKVNGQYVSTIGNKLKSVGQTISTKLDHLITTKKEKEEAEAAQVRAKVATQENQKRAAVATHITGGTGGKKSIDMEEDHKDTSKDQIEKGQRIVDRANELSGRATKDLSKQHSENGTMNQVAKVRKANSEAEQKLKEGAGKTVRETRKELVKAKDNEYSTKEKYTDNSEESQAQRLAASMKKNDAQKAFDTAKEARQKRIQDDFDRFKNKLKNRLKT